MRSRRDSLDRSEISDYINYVLVRQWLIIYIKRSQFYWGGSLQ